MLLTVEYVYNNVSNETTRESPFFVNYGYNPQIIRDAQEKNSVSSMAKLNVTELKKVHD